MKMKPLGRTGIEVSEICLGTMTWGTQNTEAEGHAQIDMALERGVNFLDTAEMYPTTPQSEATQGRTEEITGTWIAKSGRRDDMVLATKITGAGHSYVRGGSKVTGATMIEAVEGSLKRLQTDYIDLYQIHWANRGSYHFRQTWNFDPSGQDRDEALADIVDALEAADKLIKAGKIRALGLSNETAWGTMRYLAASQAAGLPRVASIQNEYSLLCRVYEPDLAEVGIHEDVGLLAFSPLAAGMLTGKYRNDATPSGSRRSINDVLGGRMSAHSVPVCDAYCALAEKHGLDPAQMAIAFTLSRPFMCASIIGATTMAQLETCLGSADLTLSDEVLAGIADIYRSHPRPM